MSRRQRFRHDQGHPPPLLEEGRRKRQPSRRHTTVAQRPVNLLARSTVREREKTNVFRVDIVHHVKPCKMLGKAMNTVARGVIIRRRSAG
jgi:hypothetical protein